MNQHLSLNDVVDGMNVDVCESREEHVEAVTRWLGEREKAALETRGQDGFHVAVSGGSQPNLLAAILETNAQLETPLLTPSKWHVYLVDERVVRMDSEHSTSGVLCGQNGMMSYIPAENGHFLDPNAVADAVDSDFDPQKLQSLADSYAATVSSSVPNTDGNGLPVLDAVLLGMGPDGHTASLFPGSDLLDAPADPDHIVLYIDTSPKPPPQRVTLSLPVINAAASIAFIATGASKAQALVSILTPAPDAEPGQSLPSARVTGDDLTWFVDQPAMGSSPAPE